jgi:hypothetical protein
MKVMTTAVLITLLNTAFGSHHGRPATNYAYNTVLKSIIHTRCSRYMPPEKKDECQTTVSSMLEILDYDVILIKNTMPPMDERAWDPRAFVFIAFKKRLIDLLSNPQTKIYLEKLNQHLSDYLLGLEKDLTIFEFTKNFYQSEDKASEVMATLFQDTTFRKLHLAYLEETDTKSNSQFESNKELLSRVIDMIGLVLDSSEENYKKLFYPENLHEYLNRNIYQFYVPFFLSKALIKSGIKKEMAQVGPLMLSLSYEFVTSSHDFKFLYLDPSLINSTHKIRDIFASFCGTGLGTKGSLSLKSKDRDYEEIKRTFETSTSRAVKLILKKLSL